MLSEFKKILSDEEIDKAFTKKDEKLYLDVAMALEFTLLKAGIKKENIDKSKYCTYYDNVFASWRRDKDKTKQMLTGIMLV